MNYRGMYSFSARDLLSSGSKRILTLSVCSTEDGTTPYMVFWRDGLKEVKLVSRRHHQAVISTPLPSLRPILLTPPHPTVNGLRLSWVPSRRISSVFSISHYSRNSIRVLCRGFFAVVKSFTCKACQQGSGARVDSSLSGLRAIRVREAWHAMRMDGVRERSSRSTTWAKKP